MLALLLLLACPRTTPPQPAAAGVDVGEQTFTVSAEHPLGRHPGADICFPTGTVGEWTFLRSRTYDNEDGLDLSWHYNSPDGAKLSGYAFPHHGSHPDWSPSDWASAGVRDAASHVADAEWTDEGTVEVWTMPTPATWLIGTQQLPVVDIVPPEVHAEVARKLGLESLDGVARDVGALIMVWSYGDWFLKLRATWLDTERTPEQVFADLVGWSGLPCEYLREQSVPMVDVAPDGSLPPWQGEKNQE